MKLIEYITVVPKEDEQQRGHKYPFLAQEIFACEKREVLDLFFQPPVKKKEDV